MLSDRETGLILGLDQFGRATIESHAERQELALGALLREAVHHYLSDRETGRVSWRYPRFRRDTPVGDEEVSVVLNLDDSVWHLFKAEAEAQRVTVERLLEHAAIYYLVANMSSGHS